MLIIPLTKWLQIKNLFEIFFKPWPFPRSVFFSKTRDRRRVGVVVGGSERWGWSRGQNLVLLLSSLRSESSWDQLLAYIGMASKCPLIGVALLALSWCLPAGLLACLPTYPLACEPFFDVTWLRPNKKEAEACSTRRRHHQHRSMSCLHRGPSASEAVVRPSASLGVLAVGGAYLRLEVQRDWRCEAIASSFKVYAFSLVGKVKGPPMVS